jgi:hypothetical protein
MLQISKLLWYGDHKFFFFLPTVDDLVNYILIDDFVNRNMGGMLC